MSRMFFNAENVGKCCWLLERILESIKHFKKNSWKSQKFLECQEKTLNVEKNSSIHGEFPLNSPKLRKTGKQPGKFSESSNYSTTKKNPEPWKKFKYAQKLLCVNNNSKKKNSWHSEKLISSHENFLKVQKNLKNLCK